jgi:hypothetical protein
MDHDDNEYELYDYESYAADGGEENDMSHEDGRIERIDEWIAGATVTQLKSAYFGIEREVARRKAEIASEAKALEAFEKPHRATRSDAGKPRTKEVAA